MRENRSLKQDLKQYKAKANLRPRPYEHYTDSSSAIQEI